MKSVQWDLDLTENMGFAFLQLLFSCVPNRWVVSGRRTLETKQSPKLYLQTGHQIWMDVIICLSPMWRLWLLLPIQLHLNYDFKQLFIKLVSGLYKCLSKKPFRLCKSMWVTECSICIAHTCKLIPSWVSSGTCKWRGHLRINIPVLAFQKPLLPHSCKVLPVLPAHSPFGPVVHYSLLVLKHHVQAFLEDAIHPLLFTANFFDWL